MKKSETNMTQNQTKRVALVTGGSRGIGFGIACSLARAGYDLAINGRRSEADVAEALNALRSLGATTAYCQADIADLAAHQTMLGAIDSQFGRLDALVNNAGVAPKVRGDILEADSESFDRLININLRGPYFLTQRVAKGMVERRKSEPDFRGVIVNVSSVSAQLASVNRGDYCISKAGVAMATQLWAARLGEFGIAVYEVRPGVIRTDMTAAVEEKYDKMFAEGMAVEPRWGEPEDVGRAVATLVAGGVPYSTGAVVPVDGGLTIPRL